MTPERYEQIGLIYQAALERQPTERADFLAEACFEDKTLFLEVASLLDAHEQAKTFLEQSPEDVAAGWQVAASPASQGSLAHYRMLSLLGKGGMGEVWLAEDTHLHRQVAVKLLPTAFTNDAERLRRFAQEARAASALNHPNIITIHEIGATTETHYLVTEYVKGETLRQCLTTAAHQQISLTEALMVAIQMTEALAAAHEAGIIHRDIKPENVMVRSDGYIKVLDFGLAKLVEMRIGDFGLRIEDAETLVQPPDGKPQSEIRLPQSTMPGIVMGTPRYMSPEQARGEKVDARTDIFSLGVTLYEMIAGHAPFVGATPSEMIAAILRDEPAPLTTDAPMTPPELQRVVHRTLQKDRDERYQTARELLTDLKRLQRHLERAEGSRDDLSPPLPPAVNEHDETAITLPQSHSTNQLTAEPTRSRSWYRCKWLAFCAVVFLVAAAWFYFHRAAPPPAIDTILLTDFDNKTGDDIFDETLKQGLATQLQQSRFVNVFPEARVRQTLRQMERADNTRVTPELAQEICERQNLKAFIAGSIAPLGSHYVITLVALRGNTSEALARVQSTAASKEQVLQALSEAAAQLRAQLGESLSSIQQSDKPLEQATTSDLRALKASSEALALMMSGRLTEAVPFAKRAVELDPKFISAYDRLTVICFGTEQPEAAADYEAKVVELERERTAQSKSPVSEYYKLDIAAWSQMLITGNLNKSLESALALRQFAPRSFTAQNNLGLDYVLIGQSEQALAPLNEALRLNPNFAAPYRLLAQSFIRLNRFAEAKNTLTQALQLKLEFAQYHTLLYQLAFISGDAGGMQQQLEWARSKPEEYVAIDWQTSAAAFAGQWRQAQDFSRRAIELAAHRDNREVAAKYATEQALRSAVLGNCQTSKMTAAQGLSFARGRLPLARAALALALCGASSPAQTLTDELAKRFPEDTLSQEVWLPAIRAALSLQLGNGKQAIEQLRNTSRYAAVAEFWPPYLGGLAYLQLQQNTEAAAEFQKILDHRGYAPLSVLYPLAQLGLARATQSRKAYDDFLAGWEAADAELLVLIAAKKDSEHLK